MSLIDTNAPGIMVSFKTTTYMLDQLDEWCEAHHVNRSRVLRALVYLLLSDGEVSKKVEKILRVAP
ncbi:hypothetical protein J7M00_06845 [bacterium]|nr:hypothetical protein [bacterium]